MEIISDSVNNPIFKSKNFTFNVDPIHLFDFPIFKISNPTQLRNPIPRSQTISKIHHIIPKCPISIAYRLIKRLITFSFQLYVFESISSEVESEHEVLAFLVLAEHDQTVSNVEVCGF